MTELTRVELGRRDHGKKIFCKVFTTGSDDPQLMMLKDHNEAFDWQKHTATEYADIPGGILRPCSTHCKCFNNILHHVDIDEQVERISEKFGANDAETRASMLLHGFCCERHEAVKKMETDSVEQVINLAENFSRKTQSYDIFQSIKTNIVLELDGYQ